MLIRSWEDQSHTGIYSCMKDSSGLFRTVLTAFCCVALIPLHTNIYRFANINFSLNKTKQNKTLRIQRLESCSFSLITCVTCQVISWLSFSGPAFTEDSWLVWMSETPSLPQGPMPWATPSTTSRYKAPAARKALTCQCEIGSWSPDQSNDLNSCEVLKYKQKKYIYFLVVYGWKQRRTILKSIRTIKSTSDRFIYIYR